MSRESGTLDKFWQTLRPIRRVNKLRGIIEVPEFTAPCGNKACLDLSTNAVGNFSLGTSFQPTTAFTLRFWFKTLSTINEGLIIGNNSCFVKINATRQIVGVVLTSDGYTVTSNTILNPDTWYYVYIIYKNQVMYMYIDDVLDTQSVICGVGNINVPVNNMSIGDYSGTATANVYLSTTEVWTKALLPAECAEYKYLLHYGGAETTLKYLFNFREYQLVETGSYFVINLVTGTHYPFSFEQVEWANDFPHPYLYNCNFVAGRFLITTTSAKFSLKYPTSKPAAANYVLCVYDPTTSKRYRLWSDDLFNPAGVITTYAGEPLNTGSYVEVWNLEGEETLTASALQDLETSILHIVTDSNSVVQTADSTVVIDTLLSAPFPLVFPIAFNVQQEYPGDL